MEDICGLIERELGASIVVPANRLVTDRCMTELEREFEAADLLEEVLLFLESKPDHAEVVLRHCEALVELASLHLLGLSLDLGASGRSEGEGRA